MDLKLANRMHYQSEALDIGAGAKTLKIKGPKGAAGRIYDYGITNVTEAFTADTLPSYVSVGDGSDADAYGEEVSLATTAIGSLASLRTTYRTDQMDTYLVGDIPADQEVTVTATAPTGGTPAGIGSLFLVVDWEW